MGTRTYLAANGHRMTADIIGYEQDGYPVVSQWDAWHSDDCPCLRDDEFSDDWS